MVIGDETDPVFTPVDPYGLARAETKAAQIARSYRTAAVIEREGGFGVQLDGRDVRTPARALVTLPTAAAAALLADEWNAQGEIVRPGTMPAVRLTNSVLDGVVRTMAEVRAEIVRYAGSDLVCYRAEEPADLSAEQQAAWDPVLDWAHRSLEAPLFKANGVIHVSQPTAALAAIAQAVEDGVGTGAGAPFRLGALHVMTTLTGSALLALAVLTGFRSPEAAWAAAHVDEDVQIRRWGADEEAMARRQNRWTEMRAAAALATRVWMMRLAPDE